jgi:hypothetical protein
MNIGLYGCNRPFHKNKMLYNFNTSSWGVDYTNYPISLFVDKLIQSGHAVRAIDTKDL